MNRAFSLSLLLPQDLMKFIDQRSFLSKQTADRHSRHLRFVAFHAANSHAIMPPCRANDAAQRLHD